MKKNIVFFLLLFIRITPSYAQLDTSYIQSYDSAFNHFIFKSNINITVSDLVNQNSSVLKLTNNNILTLSRTDIDDLGIKHYQYRQHYNNVKVEDSQFYIHTSQNDIPISANGELSYSLNINTTPSISSTQAIATAINYANATKYYWQDTARENLLKEATNNLDTSYYPNAELVIINLNASQDSLLPNYILAYKVPIFSLVPRDAYYLYIDANNENIISIRQIMKSCNNDVSKNKLETQYNNFQPVPVGCDVSCNEGDANTLYYGSQKIYTDRFDFSPVLCRYRLKNTCTGTFLYVKNGEVVSLPVDFRDDNNLWLDSDDIPGTTALWCIERTHYFYRDTYGRNSFDNGFSQVNVIVGDIVGNNKWEDHFINVGRPNPLTSFSNYGATLDLIGHEFTHGVTIAEANLNTYGESGALGESFSDIFGTMIDFYGKTFYNTGLQPNYLIGEECQYAGTVRDMSNPNVTNGADTYGGTFWLNPNCTPAQNNNWCGIHFNLGVQNFWFYLLSEGGSGTNDLGNQYCVDGIGRDKAARIAYRSLTTYLTPNSGYYSARYWSIQSALDLYGANSNEVAQVINAWYAVGLGSSSFNGSVIYNNLTIPPFSGTLTLSNNNAMLFNNLQVMPSGNLTVISNKRITMKPVSKASSGSYFHAYIDPNCLGGLAETPSNRIINGDSSIVKQENINNEVMYQNKVFISPNPTNGKFQLIIDREWMVNQMIQVVIYNNLGQTIYQSAISNLQSVIDLSSHPKGIYFIKIQTAEKIYTEKVVVQ